MIENPLLWVMILTEDKKGGYLVSPDFADELVREELVTQQPGGEYTVTPLFQGG